MFAINSNDTRARVNGLRFLLLAAAISILLMMAAGGAVRVQDAAQACPDWPTCYGQWGIPEAVQARVQVLHRALAGLSALLVWIATAWTFLRHRTRTWLSVPLTLASGLMVAQVVLGAGLVSRGAEGALPTLHLLLALPAQALVIFATVSAFYLQRETFAAARLLLLSPFARLSLWTAVVVLALMVSGAWVTASEAGTACQGWPLCLGGLPTQPLGWLALGHRFLTAVAGGLMLALFLRAWRSQRSQPVILPAASGAFILLVGQVLIGGLKVTRGFPTDLVGLHSVMSAGLWGVLAVLVTANAWVGRSATAEALEAAEPLPFRSRFKDFILLNKPIIVLLLLVTTYAGMVVGGKEIPGAALTFWTMLGGALAAGGASALNQYIDRETDKAMQRTQNRPLPGGRLKPAEGLAYGLAACLAAFFLLAGFVNLLAAVLSLAGMVYYVLLYSVWLKHLTVQNIVIGGGAGAIPPLVGWAAVTGGLDIPALFLFAIVFFWTPPHFWALALVRRNDYARGGVPMLPVVRGEVETRKQVLIYTFELVGLTLLMPLFQMAGSVYLVSALVLGGWLIHTAWKVFKQGGNKTAWKMYRYSSMYLAFLFLALMVDALV